MNNRVKAAVASVLAAGAVTSGVTACSSGPAQASSSGSAQSNLGPFTMSACKLGYMYSGGTADGPNFYTSQSAAQSAAQANFNTSGDPNTGDVPTVGPASEFSITLTATAIVSNFTVAYYDGSGKEIATGTASLLGSGPNELTAGQTATFEDQAAPSGASTCQIIGSDSGNA